MGDEGLDQKNLEDALENQAMNRIVEAMCGLDPENDDKDKAIYKRIVKR